MFCSISVDDMSRRLNITVHQIESDYRLKIEAGKDEVGVLFRLSAVLYASGWIIREATITTTEDIVKDEFWIYSDDGSELDQEALQKIIVDLEDLLFGGKSVLEYLTAQGASVPPGSGEGEVMLAVNPGENLLEIEGADKKGLLLGLSQAFYLMDINISKAIITTNENGVVKNQFWINLNDMRFQNPEFRSRLTEELKILF